MNLTRPTVIAFIVATFFLSCSKVVEFKLPPAPKSNVINANLIADSFLGATIYQTLSPTSSDSVNFISNGILRIWDENNILLVNKTNGLNGEYSSANIALEGMCYTLEFEGVNGVSTSQACIPTKPRVVILDSGIRLNNGGLDSFLFLNLELSDTSTQEKYYKVSCIGNRISKINIDISRNRDTIYEWVDLEINTNDLNYFVNSDNYDSRTLLLRNTRFNSTLAYLNFEINLNGVKELHFFFDAIDKNLFEYHRTRGAQNFVQTDPNAHYITVYRNIENGYGIMGGTSRQIISWTNN